MGTTTTTQQQTVADQPSDWSQTLPFAQFDPSLGTLDGISVTLTGDVLGTVSIESLEAAPSTVSVSLDGTVGVTSPTGVLLAQATPGAYASASLGADASTIFSGISATATAQALFQPGSVDLGDFVGTGSVPLTVAASSELEVTGPANMEVASQASAGATVMLQFDLSAPAGESNSDLYGSSTETFSPDLNFFPEPASSTTPPQTFSFADQTTGWTNSVPVLPFDSSLGLLEAINISLFGDEAASVSAENEDATPSTVSTAQTATLDLDMPNGTTAVSVAPTISASMSLGAFDGTADFAGTSGEIDQGLTQTATASATLTDPTDLALFSGSGTVALPLSAIGTSTLDGPGNLLTKLLAQAGATVSVSYTYLPWTQDTWTNPAGGDWATGTNWSSTPAAPSAAGEVEITQAGTYTITLAQAQGVESVLLDAPGAVLVVDAPLNVAAGFTLEAGTLEFNGGTLSVGSYEQDGGLVSGGSIDIDASGAIDLNAGAIDGTNVTLIAGSSIAVSSSAVVASGSVDLTAGSLVVAGTSVPIGSGSYLEFVTNPITPADVLQEPPITWTNAAGGAWSVGTNWSSSPNPPGAGADVEIDLPGTYTVTIDVATAPGVLTLDDPGLTLQDGGITSVGTIVLDAGTLDLNAVLSGTTILANGGIVTGTQGELHGDTIVGTLTLDGGTGLDISGGLTVTQADGVSPGEIESIGSAADIGFKGTQTLDNLDLVNLSLSGVRISPTDAALTLGSRTTIDVTTSSEFDSGTLVSDGTIAIGPGATLSLDNLEFTNNGTMTLAAGGTLALTGYYTTGDLGNFSNAGGLISVDGVLDNTGGTLVIAPGAAFGDLDIELSQTLVGGTVLYQGGTVDLKDAFLSDLTWRGLLDLSHESVTLQDVTVQAANGGPGSITLDDSMLELAGGGTLDNVTITASGTADTIDNEAVYGGGPLVLGSGATVDATAGGTALTFSGASLTNDGQITVAGTGEVAWVNETSFVNAGQVTVSNGAVFQVGDLPSYISTPITTTISQPQSFTNAGNFVIGSGGTLQIGAYETAIVNTGTIALTDGSSTLELDGTAVGLGTLTGDGGRLVIAGLLDNTSQTLNIDSSGSIGILQLGTGDFAFPSGVISGGTIAAQNGTVLFDSGTLDDVTWEGPLTVGGVNSNFLQVENGLHVLPAAGGPAILTLTGTNFAEVNFLDTETLTNLAITASATTSQISDSGTLSFGSSTTLTLAAGSGETITLGGGSFSNAGLISDTLETNSTITVTGTSFVNSGSIAISGAGNALLLQTGTFLNAAEITVSDGATLYLDAPISGTSATPQSFSNTGTISLDATSTLVVGGTVTNAALASIHTAGGLVELTGTLVNTSNTITLAAGTQLGNLQIGSDVNDVATPGDIQGGAIIDQSGSLALVDATLDGVTWRGPLNLNGTGDSLTILDGITLLASSGPGQGTIDLTGVNSSLDFEFGTLSNALVNLGAVGGSVSFGDPTSSPILTFGSAPPLLTLATNTTLSATTAGARTIGLTGNIANLGLIDDAQGDVALGTFTPPPIDLSDPGGGDVTVIYYPPPPPTTFDNQGTIIAAAGAGSNFTIGDETTFSNEGLIQVANDDHLIVLTSTFANTGTLSIAAGSTVEFSGTVSDIGTIVFAGTGGELRLDNPTGVTGTLLNWSIGDEIVLPNGPDYAVTVNNGTLDLTQAGTLVSAFIVGSSYNAADFPLSATSGDIVIGAPVVSWTNASGGDWGNPANWSSNPTEPSATTNVAITLPGTYGATVNDSRAVNSLLLDDPGAALTINGTLSVADTAAFDAGSVTVNGTLEAANATAIVTNAVTLSTNLAFGAAAIDATLDNTGLVQVNSGTLSLNGGGSSNASGLAAASNAVLAFGSTGTVENTFSLTGGLYQGLDTVISGSTLDASAASGVVFGTLQLAASGALLLGDYDAQTNASFTQGPTNWAATTGAPVLSGSGIFTVYGGANLNAGEDTGTGLTRLYGVSVIGGTAGFLIDGGYTVENDGWLNWSSGSIALGDSIYEPYPLSNGGTLSNVAGATFYITASGQRISGGIGGELANAGVMAVFAGGGIVNIGAVVANTGFIQVQSGTLSLNGGGSSDAGNFYVAPNATLAFGLPLGDVFDNTFSLTGGTLTASKVMITGSTLDASAASGMSFGVLDLAASGALLLGAVDAQTSGGFSQGPTSFANAIGTPFLSGSGTLTVYGGASLIDGVQSGSGLTRLFGTSQIGAIDLDGGRTLENDGWLSWSSGDIELGTGDPAAATQTGTISNVLGATFYITADALIGNAGAGASELNNAGVTAVFAGIGETDIDAYVANSGYLQAQSGTLSLNGGGSSAGDHLFVANNAVLQFGTMAGGAAGPAFAITSGQYTAGDTAITGGTLDVSAASNAVFVNFLEITAGTLQLGSLSAGVVQGALEQSGGLLTGSGLFTVYGGAALMGGVQSGPATTLLFGTNVLGGSIQIDGGRTVENAGWMNWSSGNVALGSGDPSAAEQAGTITNDSDAVFYVTSDGRIGTSGSDSGTLNNAGVLAVFAGAGETDIDAYIKDTGDIQAQSGVLGLNGGGTANAGDLYVAPNAVVQFGTMAATGIGGTFVFDGSPYIGATVVNGSTVDLSAVSGVSFGASLTVSSGELLLGGDFPSAQSFVQTGGELSGTGIFTVVSAAQLDGGLETGSGRTDLQGGGSISGPVAFDGGRSLENDGTLTWTGGSITLGGGDTATTNHSATLINTAMLEIETDGTIDSAGFSGTGTISNLGTILKAGGLGTTSVYANLFNNGVVDVTAGTLALEQGVGGTGTFLLDGAAILDFVSGAATSNTMQFLHPGGTLEVDSTGLFGPAISGYAAGDVIDAGAVLSALTPTYGFNAGTLTVTDGTHTAMFALSGSYTTSDFYLTSDAQGGTEVHYT